MDETSSTRKERFALLVSVDDEGGQLRLRFDDVVSDSLDEYKWTQKTHYTNKVYAKDAFEDVLGNNGELISIGGTLMARLIAYVTRHEN